MTDKQPMQADGDGKGGTAGTGRDAAGESGGGGYPNPHSGKAPGGFDGGQTDKDYSGPGQLAGEDVGDDGRTGQGG